LTAINRTRIIAQHRRRRKYVGERAAVDDEIRRCLEPVRQRLAEIAVVARGVDVEHVHPVDAEEGKERGRADAAAVGARDVLHIASRGLQAAGRGDDIMLAQQLQNFVTAERDGLLSDQQHVARDRPIGVLADNGVDDIAAECHCPLPIAPNDRSGAQTGRIRPPALHNRISERQLQVAN
jgi:delta-aminolevulinic acid dehydratase/porphobilinogen synthase